MKNYNFDGHKLIYHINRVNTFLKEGDCFPLYMEISPLGSCNHRCIFCAYDYIGYPNRKLETTKLLKFIDEIAECGMKSLLYAGEGEPLLHPDIDKFVIHTKKNGIDVGIYTNGQFLKEKLAQKILPYLTFVRFSFNGGTRENYADIHKVRPEVFDQVTRNMEKAANIKKKEKMELDIGLQFVLLPENINYVIDAVKTVKNLGIDYFVIKPFVQQSCFQSYQMREQFSMDAIEEVFAKAESFSDSTFKVFARRASFENYAQKSYKHCYATSFISVLNSAGDIASCLPYWDKEEFVFGNIYQNSFQEIWLGKRREKIKEFLKHKLDPAACPPNCRCNAANEFLFEIKRPSVKHLNFI